MSLGVKVPIFKILDPDPNLNTAHIINADPQPWFKFLVRTVSEKMSLLVLAHWTSFTKTGPAVSQQNRNRSNHRDNP
jgi:hypothetical protein